MITKKQIEKSIVDFLKVENNITKWGRIKKHSNVCWEYNEKIKIKLNIV
jgi:hypothetical protein